MTGMPGDNATSSEEASDPITPTIPPDVSGDRSKESASSETEKHMFPMQPGETRTTTRRLSDIPSSREPRDWKPEEEEQNTRKPLLQGAQETVARALGGTSTGAS